MSAEVVIGGKSIKGNCTQGPKLTFLATRPVGPVAIKIYSPNAKITCPTWTANRDKPGDEQMLAVIINDRSTCAPIQDKVFPVSDVGAFRCWKSIPIFYHFKEIIRHENITVSEFQKSFAGFKQNFDSMAECWVGIDNHEPCFVVNDVVTLFVNAISITKYVVGNFFDLMRSNF